MELLVAPLALLVLLAFLLPLPLPVLWLLLTLPLLRLRSLLQIVLPHYGVLRLITVFLPLQCLLLLHSGISVP